MCRSVIWRAKRLGHSGRGTRGIRAKELWSRGAAATYGGERLRQQKDTMRYAAVSWKSVDVGALVRAAHAERSHSITGMLGRAIHRGRWFRRDEVLTRR